MQNLQGVRSTTFSYPWMLGRNFDIAFFFLPIAIGIGLFGLSHASPIAQSALVLLLVTSAFGAEHLHFGITWFTYVDKKNLNEYFANKQKLKVFLIAPFIIALLTFTGEVIYPAVVTGIWMLWSIQHLVQQNVGILLLYHNHKAGEAVVDRPTEVRSQHASALFYCLLFVQRVFVPNQNPVMIGLCFVAFALMVFFIGLYVYKLWQQVAAGATLNVPALMFWLFAITCFFPFGFIGRDFMDAYLIPVVVHWFQYIGLNLRFVQRKYSTDQISNLPLARPMTLFFITGIGILLVLYACNIANLSLPANSLAQRLFTAAVLTISLTHYFLDAFIYRFRDPFQRETVLPFLKNARS